MTKILDEVLAANGAYAVEFGELNIIAPIAMAF